MALNRFSVGSGAGVDRSGSGSGSSAFPAPVSESSGMRSVGEDVYGAELELEGGESANKSFSSPALLKPSQPRIDSTDAIPPTSVHNLAVE
jgi:hypothetical protein